MAFDFSSVEVRLDALLKLKPGTEMGKALEGLVADMLAAVDGISVADRNVLSGQGDAELDLLLANRPTETGLEAFGRDILVECKSSKDALSSRDLNHFATQAKLRDLRWSIIVSLAGLTGDDEDLRAAHQVIRSNAEQRCGIVLLVEHELRAIASAEHLVNVLERKRQKMVSRLRAETFSAAELRELDPRRGVRQGGIAIQAAVRGLRRDAVATLFGRAVELPVLAVEAARERATAEIANLTKSVEEHKESPEHDPMWREVYDRLVEAGAAFVTLFDESPSDVDLQRVANFDIEFTAPRNLDAHVSGELWELLVRHYLREVELGEPNTRARAVTALVALTAEEMVAINDIDPRDVYDDYEDYY